MNKTGKGGFTKSVLCPGIRISNNEAVTHLYPQRSNDWGISHVQSDGSLNVSPEVRIAFNLVLRNRRLERFDVKGLQQPLKFDDLRGLLERTVRVHSKPVIVRDGLRNGGNLFNEIVRRTRFYFVDPVACKVSGFRFRCPDFRRQRG